MTAILIFFYELIFKALGDMEIWTALFNAADTETVENKME